MTPTATLVPTGTWQIDPIHSSVGFAVTHNGLSKFRGAFAEVSGRLSADDQGRLSLEGEAPVGSVDVQQPDLRGHLLAPDFFDAERHSTIAFRSGDLQIADDGAVALEGELTIKGVTRPIAATGRVEGPITDPTGAERIGITLETTVDRTDYGLGWNMELPGGRVVLGNDVTIEVALELAAS